MLRKYQLRKTSFVLDGEAVVLGPDGISDFDGLHSGRCNEEVRLYAFDLLADDGVDMRDETLQLRKLWLGKLFKRSGAGIIYNAYDAGAIGPRLFEHACLLGLEGIVSKHRDGAYKAGPSPQRIKVKNPKSAAMVRVKQLVRRIRLLAALSLSPCADMPHWMGAGSGTALCVSSAYRKAASPCRRC
ncbi:MAG: hypothetical protein ACJ8EK_01210 [Bradyrhizobium sp.]